MPNVCLTHAIIYHRRLRKVFESGGSNWGGGGCGRGSPSPTSGFAGITPGKFWKFYVHYEMGHLGGGGKIALCFDTKQTAILIQTFGHKWFSEVVCNGKLCSPYKFTVMHCTLNYPHTMLRTLRYAAFLPKRLSLHSLGLLLDLMAFMVHDSDPNAAKNMLCTC